MDFERVDVCSGWQKLIPESQVVVSAGYNSSTCQPPMKPYLEHIAASQEGSWTLFDRRLPAIPFEWHYNSEYELTLTLNSRGQRFIGDSMEEYDDGDLVLIGPRIPHTWCSTTDAGAGPTHQALVLWLSESFVQTLIRPHLELRSIQMLLENSTRAVAFSEEVKNKARCFIGAMLTQTAEERLPALLQLLSLLSRDAKARPLASTPVNAGSSLGDERIGRVLSHLHKKYRDRNAIDSLARLATLSPSSLHRQFKQQTGMTTSDYVSQLRIGNACALLINTSRPIALIADEVGYGNLANFNRQFKALKRQTPRQFRSAFRAPGAGIE
jgi:AraC-like DNA-binding protein